MPEGHIALDAPHVGGDTRCLQVIEHPEERPGVARVPQALEGHAAGRWAPVPGPVRSLLSRPFYKNFVTTCVPYVPITRAACAAVGNATARVAPPATLLPVRNGRSAPSTSVSAEKGASSMVRL